MPIPPQKSFVNEEIPIRWSFTDELLSFPGQTLVPGTIQWMSQTPLRAAFVIGSDGLVTTPTGQSNGLTNDGVIGRFQMLAAGICTVYVTVDAINPTATYEGIIQFNIQAVPSP